MSNVIPFRRPRQEPPAPILLTIPEIRELTQLAFPEEFYEDENELLELSESDWALLSNYFEFFGLRLPADAHAQTTHDLWRDLKLHYAPAVRVTAHGGSIDEIPEQLCNLTLAQRAYAHAVGTQDRALAQQLARGVFSGRHISLFLT